MSEAPLEHYKRLTAKLFIGRGAGHSDDDEDAILDEMDGVWKRLTQEERDTANAWATDVAGAHGLL
jgi:hypothetical protein